MSWFFLASPFVILLLFFLFFISSFKTKWVSTVFSTFECGFSSYFFSRFSFSVHYFMVGLFFLFLDLEVCLILPMFDLFFNHQMSLNFSLAFVVVLILGLFIEWAEGNLEWKN